MEYISKEDRENIEKLNSLFGTRHRVDPYDFKKPCDIIESTTMATAEYFDMVHYWMILNELDEAFDESLEYYNTAGWINISLKGTTGNRKVDTALKSLRKTESLFYTLKELSEVKCSKMWKIVLFNSPIDVRVHFFSEDVQYEEETVQKALEKLFELSPEMEYNGNPDSSVKAFSRLLLENMEQIGHKKPQ